MSLIGNKRNSENKFVKYLAPEFRNGRRIRDQIANIRWMIKKARDFQKNIYFCFIDYAKAFDCVDHNKLWEVETGDRH